jgi:hypothetical protein
MKRHRKPFGWVVFATTALAGCNSPAAKTGPEAPVTPSKEIASPIKFEEATQTAGIQFTHNNGAFGLLMMPEIMGSGVAWIDYDLDGYQDLFLVNSRDWTDAEIADFAKGDTAKTHPALLRNKASRKRSTSMLYRNNGDGTFRDVTKEAGFDFEAYGQGVAVGDYDNDGRPDLYLTALDRNFLFHNEAGKSFKEVSGPLGVKDAGWSTSAAWIDYDKDGKLDLFVCHYVKWSPKDDNYCESNGRNKDYCTPESYKGEICRLYHNDGARFSDVTDKTGISKTESGRALQAKALGVATSDFNNDGWPDIVVANDTEPNYLFENLNGKSFQEVGQDVGIALNEAGQARAAMGVDCADINRSGRESLIFGNFSNQMLSLYENQGNRLYVPIEAQSGVGEPSLKFLAFATIFADLDNDSLPDIFVATGHVVKDIEDTQRDVKFRERPLLFRNRGGGSKGVSFEEIGLKSGGPLAREVVGRGAASADYDLDGSVDLVLTANGDKAALFRNATSTGNKSIRITLEGTKSNRSGIGAVIDVTFGGATQRYTVRSGSSYCSQSELPVTAGLGANSKADVKITWPSSKVTELRDVVAGQMLLVNEDNGIVKQSELGAKGKAKR